MLRLSRYDLQSIANRVLRKYRALPEIQKTELYRIDPSVLAEQVLGLNIEYERITEDCSCLGLTSFSEAVVEIVDQEYGVGLFCLDGKTILIEKELYLSEKEVLKQINTIAKSNEITKLDEICLVRGYNISQLVGRAKFFDIGLTAIEGAATGYAGVIGLPFNLVASTFLFYRAVQSTALYYGYDIKNDPTELQIASEVFMNAMSPKNNNDSELSSAIAKVMLFTTTTSVKQTVKKGWTAMAEKGGVHLLLTQMRALANTAAQKALEKAEKKVLKKQFSLKSLNNWVKN